MFYWLLFNFYKNKNIFFNSQPFMGKAYNQKAPTKHHYIMVLPSLYIYHFYFLIYLFLSLFFIRAQKVPGFIFSQRAKAVTKAVNKPKLGCLVSRFTFSESRFTFEIEISGRIISQFSINIVSFKV